MRNTHHFTCNYVQLGRVTSVPVANQTLAYRALESGLHGTLESGLRPHETKIDRPRSVRAPLN